MVMISVQRSQITLHRYDAGISNGDLPPLEVDRESACEPDMALSASWMAVSSTSVDAVSCGSLKSCTVSLQSV